jgi:hypothetical protein
MIDGFDALNHLNSFLSDWANELFVDHAYDILGFGGRPHPSLASGNESGAVRDLPTKLRFGGDWHAKMRSLAGTIGATVNRAALPVEVQKTWDALDAEHVIFTKNVKILRDIVDHANNANLGTKHVYTTLRELELLALDIDKDKALEAYNNIRNVQSDYKTKFGDFLAMLDQCETVPLRLRTSVEGKMPEEYVTAEIPNKMKRLIATMDDEAVERMSPLQLLVLNRMAKDGIMSSLKHPYMSGSMGVERWVIENAQEVFIKTLKERPDTQDFYAALSSRIANDISQFAERLDIRDGAVLARTDPLLYESFCTLRWQLGLPAGRHAQPPAVHINTEALQHEAPAKPVGKCPFGFGG